VIKDRKVQDVASVVAGSHFPLEQPSQGYGSFYKLGVDEHPAPEVEAAYVKRTPLRAKFQGHETEFPRFSPLQVEATGSKVDDHIAFRPDTFHRLGKQFPGKGWSTGLGVAHVNVDDGRSSPPGAYCLFCDFRGALLQEPYSTQRVPSAPTFLYERG
jgi:hypothetical protein